MVQPLKVSKNLHQANKSSLNSEVIWTKLNVEETPAMNLYNRLEKTLPIGITLEAKANNPNNDWSVFKVSLRLENTKETNSNNLQTFLGSKQMLTASIVMP